ncbi:kinase-like domain-containing protein [Gymnopilus junonius]|uniref:non-specific serine/threonine protein kinase n=1 Tax=Gymnopilus junonius TaxID=109634 RepID=A0A9P5THB3_GYMJU|nr:kinase-like domain-containing protein [Gymnopilus junonius]
MAPETPMSSLSDGVETVRPRCHRSLVICEIATSNIFSSSTLASPFSDISAFLNLGPSSLGPPFLPPLQSSFAPNVRPQMSTLDLHVIRFLGEGTSGKVYLVNDELSRATIALKVVPKEGKNDHVLGVVLKERKIAEKLSDSPWFVGLWASWGDTRNLYIAMIAYPTDLDSEMLICGTIEPNRARFYMAEIIIALTELHSRGIIHRDVKAPNILIDYEGHIVLADFGLSKDFGLRPTPAERVFQPYWPYLRSDNPTSETPPRLPEELTFVAWDYRGSELEMAPEVHLRTPYSFGIDFWSAAVVLYWMLTGRPPFYIDDKEVQFINGEQSDAKSLTEKIAKDPLSWDPADNVDETTKDFLDKMMDKDPTKRLMISYDMLNHPYFIDTNWTLMEQRKVTPPWVPPSGVSHVHEPSSPPFTPGEPFSMDHPDPYPEFNFISQQVVDRLTVRHNAEDHHDYFADEELLNYWQDDEMSDTITDLDDAEIVRFGSYEDLHGPTGIGPPSSPSDVQTLRSISVNEDTPLKEAWHISVVNEPSARPYGPGPKQWFIAQDLVSLRPFIAEIEVDDPATKPPAHPGLGVQRSTPSLLKPAVDIPLGHNIYLPPLIPCRRVYQPLEQSMSCTTSSSSSPPQRTKHVINGRGVLFKVKVWMSRLWPPKSRKTDQLKRLSLLG